MSADRSLFERLGGEAAIKGLVCLLLNKLWVDERLERFFRPLERTPHERALVGYFVRITQDSSYTAGEGLRRAHQGLGLTNADLDRSRDLLESTLKELRIQPDLVEELKARLEPLRNLLRSFVNESEAAATV
jgi:hemoglobin